MNLVIVAAESKMLELKKQVEMLFSKIKNKNLSGKSLISCNHDILLTDEKGNTHPMNEVTHNLAYARAESAGSVKMTIVKSVRQQTNLVKLAFQLPSLQSQYTSKPSSYIASLLGHESKGSLLEELKRQGLGTEISCGCSFDGFSRSSICYIFEISVNLTEKGLVEYSGVIELVFQYISMLKRDGAQRWYCEENMLLSRLEFDHESDQDPMDLALDICERISSNQYVTHEDTLRAK